MIYVFFGIFLVAGSIPKVLSLNGHSKSISERRLLFSEHRSLFSEHRSLFNDHYLCGKLTFLVSRLLVNEAVVRR